MPAGQKARTVGDVVMTSDTCLVSVEVAEDHDELECEKKSKGSRS